MSDIRDDEADGLVPIVTFACVIVGLLFCLAMGLFARPAKAHEWFTHQRNPVTGALCCYGGPTGDCQAVEDEDWWRDGASWAVRKRGVVYRIPANQAQPSQDRSGKAFACIMAGQLRCFFLPVNG